jgi:hypothetical protein
MKKASLVFKKYVSMICVLPSIRVELNFDFIFLVDGLFGPENLWLLVTNLLPVLVLHLVSPSTTTIPCGQSRDFYAASGWSF